MGEHYQGDMILNEEQLNQLQSKTRNGAISSRYLWPNGFVYYALSPQHTTYEQNMIEHALRRIEAVTCIKFIRRTYQSNYVQIIVRFCLKLHQGDALSMCVIFCRMVRVAIQRLGIKVENKC